MPILRVVLLIATILLSSLIAYRKNRSAADDFLSTRTVTLGSESIKTVETLNESDLDRMLFIDARPEELYERGHIRGAQSFPAARLGVLDRKLSDLYAHNKNASIVVYCGGGVTCLDGKKVASAFKRRGFNEIFIFTGNLEELPSQMIMADHQP